MPLLAILSEGMVAAGAAIAILFVAATYAFITYDRGRAGSKNKDDTQVGLKLVLFAMIIAAISLLAEGVRELLAFVLGGFKGGSMPVRAALPAIFVGGGVIALILKVLLPRTNMNEYTQAARFTVGVLALQFGVMAIIAVYGFLLAMFTNVGGWAGTSSALASAFVSVAFAFPALRSFGSMSGWVEPPRQAPAYPPAGYGPPPGGGFPPQGGYGPGSGPAGGMPPGGGYGGPPSGGMPPQGGGGYGPPGGGGYGGPQGGGAPPQGGGGYGPPGGGGGGYPPR